MKSWDGMEFELEKYISDTGDTYDESLDIEELIKDLESDEELKSKILTDTQSTQVFQYIKSLS